MRVVIRADEHLAQYGNQLGALGAGQAARLMAMALNSEGNKGRTRVRQALMAQTGIRSHQIGKAMRTVKAGAGRLQYTLEAHAGETNVSMFGLKVQWRRVTAVSTRERMKLQWVSASPWNQGREFPGAFSIKRFGKRVFKRTSDVRFPLKPVYGPNLAREIVKAQSRTQFETIAPRVGVEVGRLLGLVLGGSLKLGTSRGFDRG
jgi:hypothetical protein